MTVGIIGAMAEEIEELKAALEGCGREDRAGFSFFTGSLNGVNVVLLLSGIGKVNAAMGTSLLLERYSPDCVINTGSAGGFSTDLKIGDVVVSSGIRHHDVDVTAFGYEHGQVPQMPGTFEPHSKLVELAEKAIGTIEGIDARKGLIATGDSFVHREEHRREILDRLPTVAAVEMEAAAIAQCCHNFATPYVVVRAISDIPENEDNQIDFRDFLKVAAVNSAKMVVEILRQIREEKIVSFS